MLRMRCVHKTRLFFSSCVRVFDLQLKKKIDCWRDGCRDDDVSTNIHGTDHHHHHCVPIGALYQNIHRNHILSVAWNLTHQNFRIECLSFISFHFILLFFSLDSLPLYFFFFFNIVWHVFTLLLLRSSPLLPVGLWSQSQA